MLTFFIVIQDQELEIRSGTIFIPTVSYSAPAVGVSPVSIVHISLASIKNKTSNTEYSTHHLHRKVGNNLQ